MKKIYLVAGFISIFLIALSVFAYLVYIGPKEIIKSGLSKDIPAVNSEKSIDSILKSFEKVSVKGMPAEIVELGDFNNPNHRGHFYNRFFYKISPGQAKQKIVGDWRIIDFIGSDQKQFWYYPTVNEYYWLMDKKVLHAFLKLKIKMEEKNLDWKAIKLNSGHRSPYLNKRVKGAPMSRHICGDAIDFSVGDADKNGIVNYVDKQKVLDLCEQIIGDKGGIGLYPKTQAIHIDTRGFRTRWNSY